MNKKLTIALGAALLVFSACSATPREKLQNEGKLGIIWFQNSGEYQALTHQAFNAGKKAYLENKTNGKNAVIVDLDETMVDNSPYAAWQAINGQGYSKESWDKWCEAKEAKALPGAVDFANFVANNGGEMFYISNRTSNLYEATAENLKALGFPQVDSKHLLLKENTSDKAARVNHVKDQGYKVVIMAGDNLDDFGSDLLHKSNKERVTYVNANEKKYGEQWIILPNPMYGGFESGLSPDYMKLSPRGQLKVREASLNPWSGK
ncbi:5'-nucleotidase, lipoprotein e(P4) family [Cetobacterium sp. SF1]|uniref:5'-nucleotidase, lipoprotein e(P4) family n=1 Tax=Cetobacterium sp. SF1 TaxID=3417654 RepID=UPI003CF79C13